MQDYTPLGSTATTTVKEGILNHEKNINALRSTYSGTAFPTENLVAGLKCYRTDLGKTYTYNGKTWDDSVNTSSLTVSGETSVPTPATANNSKTIANTEFVHGVVSDLVNGAPTALDTLQELATALGNDPNFSTTILNKIGEKESKTDAKIEYKKLQDVTDTLEKNITTIDTSYLGAKPYLKGSGDGETPIQVTVPAERGIYPIFNGYPDAFPAGFNRNGLIVNFLGDSGTTLSLYALNENNTLLMRTGWGKSWRSHWYKLATQETVDNSIANAQKDNAWLWNSLHRLGQNYKLPSTNSEINKLGVFSSYYNTANVIPNQPTRYGQLINIPADMQDEGTQLWLSQADGAMYHRGGNSSTPVTSTKFKRFLDNDDYSRLQNAEKVVSVPVTNVKGTDHIADVVCLKSGHVVWVQFTALKVESGYAGSRANASITGLPKPLYRVWTLGDTMGLHKGMSHLRGFVYEDYFTWHYCPAWEIADGDECVYNFTYLTND